MEEPNDLADAVRRLETRVQNLESLYSLIDLLALPGLLAGGAARIFDCVQSADTIAAQAVGFYGKEMASRGLAIRWTRFPDPGQLDIAVLGSIPFALELRVLHTPHVTTSDDVLVHTAEGEQISFESANHLENGVLEFVTVMTRPATGLLRLSLSSRSHLEGSGGDTRKLGLPFVHLRSHPHLATPPPE
jgi:hypothetical protein